MRDSISKFWSLLCNILTSSLVIGVVIAVVMGGIWVFFNAMVYTRAGLIPHLPTNVAYLLTIIVGVVVAAVYTSFWVVVYDEHQDIIFFRLRP